MEDLTTRFESATRAVMELDRRPSNAELLDLYGLFKQATEGDVSGERPGLLDPRGRAKWDAWAALRGTSTDEAKSSYVRLVESLSS